MDTYHMVQQLGLDSDGIGFPETAKCGLPTKVYQRQFEAFRSAVSCRPCSSGFRSGVRSIRNGTSRSDDAFKNPRKAPVPAHSGTRCRRRTGFVLRCGLEEEYSFKIESI